MRNITLLKRSVRVQLLGWRYKIRKRKKKGEGRERKAGKCKREAERGSWGRKTRKIDGETLKGRGKGEGEEAGGRGKRQWGSW